MASKPGILTEWPWQPLGRFKYVIVAPWAIHGTYSFIVNEASQKDLGLFLIFPFLLIRMLHNQIWISYSRYKTAKGNNRIIDKGLEFDQVDRESNWDDQILFNGILFYIGHMLLLESRFLPLWKTDGVILTALLHAGPVEFLYYWLHRALHHHFLYSRYHSHHHSSIVTEPITSVIHPFAEHIAYFMLFAIPLYTTVITKTASIVSFAGYITYIDFMNNLGHCNFEHIPKSLFSIFPPLKFLIYTPSFHSLHHTQFRTNYSLFMPIYDYVYNTTDKSSDSLYETSLKREEDTPDVVHLVHLTTPESIYHLQTGFASLSSKPYTSKWYFWVMWPITFWSMILTSIYGRAFVAERLHFNSLKLQSWVVPKYRIQYLLKRQREAINYLIEEAIVEADKRGVKVLSLGLLNQGQRLNGNGEMYVQRNRGLKVKVVDGSSLAVAVVVNSIPKGTSQVLLTSPLSKMTCAIAFALCQKGIQVAVSHKHDLEKLKRKLITVPETSLIHSASYAPKVWVVGDELSREDQFKAKEGTIFIPSSQFPPKKLRNDCFYYTTPAMIIPKSIENMHSCENWLPRRVMSAWRIAGIVHALEGWNVNECGLTMFNTERIWEAALRHGFRPLFSTTP